MSLKHKLFQSTLLMRGTTFFRPFVDGENRRFQSTLLMRGATSKPPNAIAFLYVFQSTLLMRGATIPGRYHGTRYGYFNPRSSCEERRHLQIRARPQRHFNPRSSCEERLKTAERIEQQRLFQSTLLMRGATQDERHRAHYQGRISIHAPHARSDID